MIRHTMFALLAAAAIAITGQSADAGHHGRARVYSPVDGYYGAYPYSSYAAYNSYGYYPYSRYYGFSGGYPEGYGSGGYYGSYYNVGYRPYWAYNSGYVYPYNYTYSGWPYSAVFYRPVYPYSTMMPVSNFGWGYGGGSCAW